MMEYLGSHLRAIRQAKGLTMREVRKRSGLSIPFISEVERDMQNPSVMSLYKLAEAYNLTLSKLLDGYNPDPIPFVTF